MELVVFDLDGTLLNADSQVSTFTQETLARMVARGIPYTVATGRTLQASRAVLRNQGFRLPQAFKNGVLIWQPEVAAFSQLKTLTPGEIRKVESGLDAVGLTPYVFTLEDDAQHAIYRDGPRSDAERLLESYQISQGLELRPASDLRPDATIINISAIGPADAIGTVRDLVAGEPLLVSYTGQISEASELNWIDIHHSDASKGSAVDLLREQLGAERIICFGDGDNDLSMFERADESFAPANGAAEVRDAATDVIGHHDDDGVARYLRQRYRL
ncbi:MAG: HAD family hydrolase [Pseudomonadota bacterium]